MLIDTNILLRILLQDHPLLTPRAEALLKRQPKNSCQVTGVVVAEVVYVLFGNGYPRANLVEAIQKLFAWPQISLDEPVTIETSLTLFAQTNLDYADCYLCARAVVNNTLLQTFDKKLQKLYEATR